MTPIWHLSKTFLGNSGRPKSGAENAVGVGSPGYLRLFDRIGSSVRNSISAASVAAAADVMLLDGTSFETKASWVGLPLLSSVLVRKCVPAPGSKSTVPLKCPVV